jgi:hypothetical protein
MTEEARKAEDELKSARIQALIHEGLLNNRVPVGMKLAILREKMNQKLRAVHPLAAVGSVKSMQCVTGRTPHVQIIWYPPDEIDYFHIMKMCSGFKAPFCDPDCPVYASSWISPLVHLDFRVAIPGMKGTVEVSRGIPEAQLGWFIQKGYIKVRSQDITAYEISCSPEGG